MPRGPEEWGPLLYDQQWARERRYKDPKDLFMGPVIVLMGFVVVGLSVWMMTSTSEAWGVGLMLMLISVVLIIMGYGEIASQYRRMPFRIYERGFTLTPVPIGKGIRREGVLVPVERVKGVKVESHSKYGLALKALTVTYEDEMREDKEDSNAYSTLDDPLRAMLAFRKIVPDRLDDSVMEYVGPGTEDTVFSNPIRERGRTGRDSGRILMVIGMTLFMTLAIAAIMGEVIFSTGWWNLFGLFPFPFIFGMALVFIGMLFMLSKREFRSAVSDQAKVDGEAISLPRPRTALLFAKARSSIPFSEVLAVRRFLEPYTWGSSAHMETASGEDFEVPQDVFESLKDNPDFEREGFSVRNRRPFRGKGMPTVAAAWHRGLLLLLFPTMVFLVLAFLGESIGEAIFEGEASENVVYYLILFVFFVLLPLRIILGKRLSNRERLGQGFDADGRGVTIPKAPRPFSWIPRESVGAITTDKDSLGPFVTMEVYATSIELPLIVADTLTDAGYEVSDPMGALVRRMDPDELGEPKMPDLMADETGTGRPASFFGRGYDTSIDDHLSVPRSAGMALSLPLLVAIPAVIAGLVLGWYASLDADVLEEGFRTGRSMLATFPVALGIYLLLMLVLMRTNFGGRWKWKLSPAVLTAVVVALMVAFAPVYASTEASVFAPNMDARVTDELPENTLEIRPYVGEDLEVAGAITVGPGENLSLVGTRLSFRGPDEGMRGLWVAEGGTLHVENSTIERLGFHEKFAIEIQGTAMIRNSYITYNSDGQDDQERNRGLVVRSDDVSVVNTTFNGMFTVAILVISASSVVEGCSFSELGEYGIFIHRSDVEIADTLFSTCENPVMLTQSEARVSGCQFVQCPLGMVLWQSEVDVTDCLFTNTTGTAFFESPESEVRTSNNTYNEVGNLTRDYMFYYSQKDTCLVTTLMLGAMTMAILVSANGHRPKPEVPDPERVEW